MAATTTTEVGEAEAVTDTTIAVVEAVTDTTIAAARTVTTGEPPRPGTATHRVGATEGMAVLVVMTEGSAEGGTVGPTAAVPIEPSSLTPTTDAAAVGTTTIAGPTRPPNMREGAEVALRRHMMIVDVISIGGGQRTSPHGVAIEWGRPRGSDESVAEVFFV